jgi:hypothetical protein
MMALTNRQMPLKTASTIFVIVFVVRLARMGSTASFTLSFSGCHEGRNCDSRRMGIGEAGNRCGSDDTLFA